MQQVPRWALAQHIEKATQPRRGFRTPAGRVAFFFGRLLLVAAASLLVLL